MVLQNNDVNLNNVCVSGIRSVALFDVRYAAPDDDIGCSGHQILIESGISKRTETAHQTLYAIIIMLSHVTCLLVL